MAQSRHNVSVSSLSNTITEFSSGLFSPVQSSSLLLGLSCPDPVLHSRSYWKNPEEKPSHLRAAVPRVPPPAEFWPRSHSFWASFYRVQPGTKPCKPEQLSSSWNFTHTKNLISNPEE